MAVIDKARIATADARTVLLSTGRSVVMPGATPWAALFQRPASEETWKCRYVSISGLELFGAVQGSLVDLCRATL